MRNTLTILFIAFTLTVFAQKKETKEEAKWDVSNPGKDFNYKTHNFNTDEGTWMNLDVSPMEKPSYSIC